MVDVAEADDRHHALAGEQGVEEGARLGEVQVLICIDGCVGSRECVCVCVSYLFIIKRACVMMSAPAIPKPTRSSPGVCGCCEWSNRRMITYIHICTYVRVIFPMLVPMSVVSYRPYPPPPSPLPPVPSAEPLLALPPPGGGQGNGCHGFDWG